jgi:hypothetical protein
MVQPDGSVVLIDPMTGKTTPVPGARGIPTQHNIDPNSPAGVTARVNEYQATTGAGQRAQAAREEAQKRTDRINQGLGLLGSVAKGGPQDPITSAFGQAFQSVRAGNKKMHPGEVAFYAWEQLQKLRPDLIPPKPRAPNALDELLSGASESPGTATTPAAPSAAPASLPPLTPEEKQAASADPGFAGWLKRKKGYTEKAWAQ